MISRETIESFDEDSQREIKMAISTLSFYGVFQREIELWRRQLIDGTEDEAPADLAIRILTFRQRLHPLQEVHELGVEYHQEQTQ